MYIPMSLQIKGKLQDHASRICDGVACICVGMSVHVSWVAEYRYVVTGGVNAGYGNELKNGKIFAKVTHDMKHYAVPVEGDESKKLYAEYKVVEHWRIKASRSSAISDPDCINFRLPFAPKTRCGLLSVVDTTAEIEILVAGSAPDKSWESGAGAHYYDDNNGEWDGKSRSSPSPDSSKRTPDGAQFAPPEGAGETTKAEKKIKPDPDHCRDWGRYLIPTSGGGYRNRGSEYAPPGKYYSHSGSVSEKDPEGGSTVEINAGEAAPGSDLRIVGLRPVNDTRGLRPVTHAENELLPVTAIRGHGPTFSYIHGTGNQAGPIAGSPAGSNTVLPHEGVLNRSDGVPPRLPGEAGFMAPVGESESEGHLHAREVHHE